MTTPTTPTTGQPVDGPSGGPGGRDVLSVLPSSVAALLTAAVDEATDPVVLLRADHTPVYANRVALEMVAPDPWRARSGCHGPELWVDDALRDVRVTIQRVAEGAVNMAELETPLPLSDGSMALFDVRVTAVELEGEPVPRHVFVVARDVRRIDADRERLRISERWFRGVFEHSPIPTGIVRLGGAGERVLVQGNAALAALYREPLADLVGRDLMTHSAQGDLEPAPEVVRGMVDGRVRGTGAVRSARRRDGTTMVLDASATRIDLAGADDPAVLVHLLDVTDRERDNRLAGQRVRAAESLTEIVTGVLAGEPIERTYERTVAGMREVFAASDAAICFRDPLTGRMTLVEAVGRFARGLLEDGTPIDAAFVAEHFGKASAVWTPDSSPSGLPPAHGAAARFDVTGGQGWLAVARPWDGPDFHPGEVELLTGLARQLALAVELGRTRADGQRLALLEERQRLARDLHDTVLQDLIASGMQLGLARRAAEPVTAERIGEVTQSLVQTIRSLRGAVFQLRRPVEEERLEDTVRSVVAAAARALGFPPSLTVTGPLDDVPAALQRDVAAVLTEALSNVIRHSGAAVAGVCLEVSGGLLSLTVSDDGAGPPDVLLRGNGLANLAERAALNGGSSRLVRRDPRGAALEWTAALRPPAGRPA